MKEQEQRIDNMLSTCVQKVSGELKVVLTIVI
jgi:hypothetical protein